jgi:hypothetical protein
LLLIFVTGKLLSNEQKYMLTSCTYLNPAIIMAVISAINNRNIKAGNLFAPFGAIPQDLKM